MPDDKYPYPLFELLPVAASEDDLAAYEETLVLHLNDWIEERGGSVHGHSGLLLSVDLDGHGPSSRLRLHYRSHAGGEYDAYWPVWSDQGLPNPPMAAGCPNLESPASRGGLLASNWAGGYIRAADDPYWAAVERQKQAIADWQAAYPEAAAATPAWEPESTADQQQAMWTAWARRFPAAAARRREVWRPVEDFLREPPAPRS